MNIFVSGSLAFDRIMNFPGYFSDHILPEKTHMLNVSFTVNGLEEKFGGTAGNIAYALSLLDEKPTVIATMGRDYDKYSSWLEENNISNENIKIIEEEFTASAYITTDLAANQMTAFNPGAMRHPISFDFNGFNSKNCIAIIAAGNITDMIDQARILKAKGIKYIFDPGQSIPAWCSQELARSIQGSNILISNDYELELISRKTEMDRGELLKLVETIITTKGKDGSIIYSEAEEIAIPAAKPKTIADPTGAGDAFRGGLIKGIVESKDISQCSMMGTVCASFAIEYYGTQEYRFSLEQFNERLQENFLRS